MKPRHNAETVAAVIADIRAGATWRETAARHEVSLPSISRWLRASAGDDEWPPRRDHSALIADLRSGMLQREAAEKHGVPRSTVSKIACQHGLGRDAADDPVGLPEGDWVLDHRRRIQVWQAAS